MFLVVAKCPLISSVTLSQQILSSVREEEVNLVYMTESQNHGNS